MFLRVTTTSFFQNCTSRSSSTTYTYCTSLFSCTVSPLVEKFAFPKNLTRGKRLRVICTVTEGDLPLQVEWWKDGLKIGDHDAAVKFGSQGVQVRRIDEYTSLLAISFLETTHAGNYSCVASNAVASFSRSAELTIRGK